MQICSVRSETPASAAGLRPRDFVTRINGQVVRDLQPKDVERIVRDSGLTLFLDVER